MLALITATRNSIATIDDALASARPIKDKIKHYFVDATSSDGTLEYLQSFIRTTDNAVLLPQTGTGLYPALNQGIRTALTDPAVSHIGLLHSDDRLISATFGEYVSLISRNQADIFYSDIEFHDHHDRRVRVWRSGRFSMLKLRTGWMPPHTSVIVAKRIYLECGLYDDKFGTAADYHWLVRVLSCNHGVFYFPQRTLTMRVGGASSETLAARFRANAMDGKVWADRSLAQSLLVRVCKPFRKVSQFSLFPH